MPHKEGASDSLSRLARAGVFARLPRDLGQVVGADVLRWERFPRAAALTALAFVLFAVAFALAMVIMQDRPNPGLHNLCQWDCIWYESIIEEGYDLEPRTPRFEANLGFYPGFPLAVGGVMALTGLDFTASAVLLNAVYTLLFVWLALSSREELLLRSDRDAALFLLAFLLTPFSIFNRVPYTEAQFNLAILATFVAWRRGALVAAALAGAALTMTRVTGIFLPIALLVELLVRERWRLLDLLKAPDGRFRALAVMPFGAVAFFVFLAFHIGDPLANFRVQNVGWLHPLRNPVETLVDGFMSFHHEGTIPAIVFGLSAVVLIVGWRQGRIPPPLALMALCIVTMPTFTGLLGLPRYAFAIFPIYLAVPALSGWARWSLLTVFVVLHVIFVIQWSLGGFGMI